ncbi:MAG: hypothetical protein K1X75_10180 [Leptospirales bacterium]|nr:hypothetical protein [Leptospirales bacterium]
MKLRVGAAVSDGWRVLATSLFLFATLALPVLYLQNCSPRYRAPGAISGDEPHYLLMAQSLARDFDLDLANNYASKSQAGRYYAGIELDHHTYFVDRKQRLRIAWDEAYEIKSNDDPPDWRRLRIERRADYRGPPTDGLAEAPLHSPGYPLLLAATFGPLLRLAWSGTETIILLVQLALFSWGVARLPLQRLAAPVWRLLILLSSLAAYYIFTFYTESLSAIAITFAIGAMLRRQRWLLAVSIAALCLTKDSSWPLAAALWLAALAAEDGGAGHYLLRGLRRLRSLLPYIALSSAPVALLALWNSWTFGEWKTQSSLNWSSHPAAQALELLVGARHGALIFSPVVLAALLLLWQSPGRNAGQLTMQLRPNVDRHAYLAPLMGLAFLLQWLLASLISHGIGGDSAGYRTLCPQLLALMLALILRLDQSFVGDRRRPAIVQARLALLALAMLLSAGNSLDLMTHRFEPPPGTAWMIRLISALAQWR